MSKYLGKRFEGKYGWFQVVEDNGWDKMVIKFDDGFTMTTSRQMIDKRSAKSPLFPIVSGVGYLGIGKYTPNSGGKVTLEYNTWIGLIHRCYDEKRQLKDTTYLDKFVDDRWHNFQNFAEWCQTAVGFGNKGWELDKDLIVKGNLCYGPDTCCFVPKELNLIVKANKRGKNPVGVWFCKEENKYRASIRSNGSSRIIGRFNSSEEAFNCYKEAKEQSIKDRLLKYKDSLDVRVFNSLMKWEINIDD